MEFGSLYIAIMRAESINFCSRKKRVGTPYNIVFVPTRLFFYFIIRSSSSSKAYAVVHHKHRFRLMNQME